MDLLKTAGDVLRTVAPLLGNAIGGPLGSLAARTVSELLLGKADASSEEVSAALLTATPDQLLALKKADNDFKVQMQQLEVDVLKLKEQGVDSARNREIAVKDKMPAILGGFTILAFFSYIALVTFYPFESRPNMEFVNLAVGWIGGMATAVGNYYFGSSSGSDKKNDMLVQVAARHTSANTAS